VKEEVKAYVEKFPAGIVEMYGVLRRLIYESAAREPEEMLWAKLPSYYVGNSFVRLIPFKDHINIEACSALGHREELTGCKITPKGMVQIYLKQEIPCEVLKRIFRETLDKPQ